MGDFSGDSRRISYSRIAVGKPEKFHYSPARSGDTVHFENQTSIGRARRKKNPRQDIAADGKIKSSLQSVNGQKGTRRKKRQYWEETWTEDL